MAASSVNFGVLLVDTLDSTFDLGELISLSQQAEESGFYRVGVSDHQIASHVRTYDPIVCMTAIANATNRVRIAAQVMVLPLRHPLQVAQALTSIDILSNGRAELGVGVGGEWSSEFEFMGVDLHTRGKRTDEALMVIRSLWENQKVDFVGRHFQIEGLESANRPIQFPGPTIVVGGRSDKALERAAKFGDRWDGIFLTVDKYSELNSKLSALSRPFGRELGTGLVVWACVGSEHEAKCLISKAMSSFYQVPFEKFSKFALWGEPERIADRLREFVDAGASEISLIPVGDLSHQIELLAELTSLV